MADESPYVSQLGRISGKLLSANLIRNGVDLKFRNGPNDPDLLYIDVNDSIRVRDNLIVDNTAKIDNIIFNANGSITTEPGPIEIRPSGPDAYVELGKVLTTDFEIKDNYINGLSSNADIVLMPSGTGIVNLQSDAAISNNLTVTGNVNVDGNLTKNGNIIIGDNNSNDTVDINTFFTQTIFPGTDNFYTLGTVDKQWNNLWASNSLYTSFSNIENVVISDQTRIVGNTISTINSNDDLFLESLTNNIIIEELNFNNNVITNLDTTTPDQTPLQLEATGNGYIKFTDTGAMRIPVGTIAERVGKEVGETRWNTELGYLECFDGTVWQVATGGGVIVTPEIQQELSEIYALVFG